MPFSRIARHIFCCLCLVALAALPGAARADAPPPSDSLRGHRVVRVPIRTDADLKRLNELSPDMWSHGAGVGGIADFRIPPETWADFIAAEIPHEVLIEDVQTLIDRERAELLADPGVIDGTATYFSNFRTRDEVRTYLDSLIALNPGIAAPIVLDTLSIQGREIFGVHIRGTGGPANKVGFLINGCQHAREWVAVTTPMYMADKLIRGYGVDPQVTTLLDNVEFFIIPIVNPDGYVHSWTAGNRLWRKNRRDNGGGTFGVDNNRNWGYQWGGAGASTNPSAEDYRGTSPFSEPETQAMRNFIEDHTNIRATIDFHSYSQLVLSPWAYTVDAPPDLAEFNQIGADMAAAILSQSGAVYEPGPVSTTLYLASGGSVDWTYGARGIFSWTIELRDTGTNGFTLPASQIIPTGEENWRAVLALGEWAYTTDSIRFRLAPEPEFAQPNTPTPLSVQVRALPGALVATGTPELLYQVNTDTFTSVPLTYLGGQSYSVSLPGAPCDSVIEHYFSAQDTAGAVTVFPAGAPSAPNTLNLPVYEQEVAFDDTLETAIAGWTIGAPGDAATTGIWLRADPVGTAAQPEDDHTPAPGVNCYITGNGSVGGGVGQQDVDNGATTLTSPTLDASGDGEAFVSFWLWYYNDGADTMPISLSNNNGATWTQVELLSQSTGAWTRKAYRIADFLPPTNQMKVRWVARDLNPGNIVEAGVDDVQVYLVGCDTIPGDVNGDGVVNFADLNIVLGNFGQSGPPGTIPGDADGDGDVDFADLNIVLSNFGAGV